jgi:hypothetical protein
MAFPAIANIGRAAVHIYNSHRNPRGLSTLNTLHKHTHLLCIIYTSEMHQEISLLPKRLAFDASEIRIENLVVWGHFYLFSIGSNCLQQMNNGGIFPPDMIRELGLLINTPPEIS